MKALLRACLCTLIIVPFASCATAGPAGSTVVPAHSRFAKPADNSLAVESVPNGSLSSPWIWKIPTIHGVWQMTCRCASAPEGDRYQAALIFADGTRLNLPDKAVTAACRAISGAPDLAAWAGKDGTIFLCLGGAITATRSEGTFAIKDRRITGWSLREITDDFSDNPPEISQEIHEVPLTP